MIIINFIPKRIFEKKKKHFNIYDTCLLGSLNFEKKFL